MHSRKKGKTGFLALKLDVSKAYDRMERPFLYSICKDWAFLKNGLIE